MQSSAPTAPARRRLINLLSGELRAIIGSESFSGTKTWRDSPPEQRSRLGIGRSYQKTNIFPSFTALENCRLAAQSRDPRPLHW